MVYPCLETAVRYQITGTARNTTLSPFSCFKHVISILGTGSPVPGYLLVLKGIQETGRSTGR